MAGFMGASTALSIFEVKVEPEAEKVRKRAFSEAPDPDGRRVGWVGLGDPLDQDFSFGINQGRFMAFSLRVDERKPSGAAIRIRLAEAIRKEEAEKGGKISKARKKELKEAVTAAVTAKADFIPTLTDCIVDLENGRLYVSSTTPNTLKMVLEQFQKTFGREPEPLTPNGDLCEIFARIFRDNLTVNGQLVSPCGYAVTLASPQQQEDKAKVVVANSQAAIATALDEGLRIIRMALAVDDDESRSFSLDSSLAVSGLKLPKAEKGSDEDATFILKADSISGVAELVKALGG